MSIQFQSVFTHKQDVSLLVRQKSTTQACGGRRPRSDWIIDAGGSDRLFVGSQRDVLLLRYHRSGQTGGDLPSRAVCPPDPVKPPQCVERSVADVQGGMNLSEVFLSHQRQATDAKVGVKRVRMTVRPFSKTAHQTVLRRQNVVPVLFKVCVLEDI